VTYDSLDQACRLAGYRTSWLRSGTVDVPLGLRAIVADVDDVLEAEVLLNQLPAEAAAIPCVVLAHFPRLADVKRLSSDGRTTVVAKPFRLHDRVIRPVQVMVARAPEMRPESQPDNQ